MKKIYLLATVVAIITGIAVFLFATELQNGQSKIIQPNLVSVVVAASDISENTTLTAEMLTTVLFPENTIPETAVKDSFYLIGKVAKYPLKKGEQFLTEKVLVIGDEQNYELADRVQKGYRAFTISVDEVSGIAGYLRVGDKVDIIITKSIDGVSTTSYLLQDILIIAVGNSSQFASVPNQITEYSNITLEVLSKDCVMLNHSIVNGLVKIVLRGYGDKEIITSPIANN
ncbi:MAG: Flp pilus assembly protein CpaB [Clostridiales bacterium GWF2_36_10]|nr:MAG: Flp pilus assembly protein CpaB [Clostridiales bacterium GWF2_36_10]HAN20190.1 Flp pilus assembly protein CpaB [Clostridiales bacterium]